MLQTLQISVTMVDGIKIATSLSDFQNWAAAVGLSFHTPIVLDTGEIKQDANASGFTIKHFAEWRGYRLVVRETIPSTDGPVRFHLILQGSLHKAYYGGQNYLPFTTEQLAQEIAILTQTLQIPAEDWQVQNLEFGVNICIPDAPITFIRNSIIMYKQKPFIPYRPDRGGKVIGSHAIMSQYEFKIYDKSAQFQLPTHLMRIELSFKKMQSLNKIYILTLADLLNTSIQQCMSKTLLAAWNHVLLYDIEADPSTLPICSSHKRLLIEGRHPTYWMRLAANEPKKVSDRRKSFRRLVSSFGRGSGQTIRDSMSSCLLQTQSIKVQVPFG